ncbi:PLD nuclease N-terminal domain-containing protein [Streptomyces sp. NPDC059740]|uniref:PLD nuclease N-terminal domain-containing protein n=1 Tax=Streptomyces sp. NPDC059740 TaxID=3346926 RepID=UPI00365D3EE9
MLRYLPFLLVLALWIYAFVDCLQTPEEEVRGLPKTVWALVILLFGEVLVGPVAWLIAGRPRGRSPLGAARDSRRSRQDRVAPDDDPEFLRSLDTGAARRAEQARQDEQRLSDWEADLRRREEELRRRESDGRGSGAEETPGA